MRSQRHRQFVRAQGVVRVLFELPKDLGHIGGSGTCLRLLGKVLVDLLRGLLAGLRVGLRVGLCIGLRVGLRGGLLLGLRVGFLRDRFFGGLRIEAWSAANA